VGVRIQKRRAETLEALHASLDAGNREAVVAMMETLVDRADRFELLYEKLRKHHFGKKSERLNPQQLALLMGEINDLSGGDEKLEVKPEAIVDEGQPREGKEPKPERGKRKPLPRDLPRQTVAVRVPEEARRCAGCGESMPTIGAETSEVLDWIPGHFEIRRYEREKCACRCGDGSVVTAPAPSKVIEKGLPGAGLLAHVVVSKYQDHLPLYRQQQIFRRQGVDLSRATLGRWCAEAAALLEPVARAIQQRVLAAHVLQTDDTHLRVLDRDRPGGSKRGFLWVYVGDRRWACFDYTETRCADGPLAFLSQREGAVQADAYSGYDALFDGEHARCYEVGCWAHVRRGFVEALEAGDVRAAQPLDWIQALYQIEEHATREGLAAAQRQQLREEQSQPVLAQIDAWLQQNADRAPPKSPLAVAIGYARNQWQALVRYIADGELEIDNNRSERLMRLIAVGRKNYLFAGSDAGARHAAVLYTVIATCRLHGIDAFAYLADVCERIATGWPQSRLADLLPDAWLAANPEAPRSSPPA
jgi:transposase